MGSSAPSARTTATLAFDGLFNLQLSKNRLIKYAAEGEIAGAGPVRLMIMFLALCLEVLL